jgi:hypothetical protein
MWQLLLPHVSHIPPRGACDTGTVIGAAYLFIGLRNRARLS